MKDIILDTNFIISAVNYKIDIKEELNRICPFLFRICIIDKTILELKKLTETEKTRLDAILALKISQVFNILRTHGEKYVDELLIDFSKSKSVIVATNDKELKEKLSCPVIVIRNKKYFELKNSRI